MEEQCLKQGCDRRLANLEEHKKEMLDPEKGVLALMHEKINKKISLGVGLTVIVVIIGILTGSYGYTTYVAAEARADNARLEDKADKDMDSIKKDLKEDLVGMESRIMEAIGKVEKEIKK